MTWEHRCRSSQACERPEARCVWVLSECEGVQALAVKQGRGRAMMCIQLYGFCLSAKGCKRWLSSKGEGVHGHDENVWLAGAASELITVCRGHRVQLNRSQPKQLMPMSSAQVHELWLSSEDTGAYGRDLGTPLPQLLAALTGVLGEVPPAPDGGPRVMMRLGMTNPPFILEHLHAVAEVCHVATNTHRGFCWFCSRQKSQAWACSLYTFTCSCCVEHHRSEEGVRVCWHPG